MKPLIVANWKCNPTSQREARRLFNSVKRGVKNIKNVEVVICPPFVWLAFLVNPKSYILNPKLGAQDLFWEERGAFTGEISAKMLKNLFCHYVIVGHSERRKYFAETDEIINKKIKAALKAKLKPILCIGETKEERKEGITFKILKKQLKADLNHLTTQSISRLILAYEPVWAIGSGKPCKIKEANEVRLFIKSFLKNVPLLYGGSVNSKNALDYMRGAKFDGLLIGGASLKAKEFVKIVKKVAGY